MMHDLDYSGIDAKSALDVLPQIFQEDEEVQRGLPYWTADQREKIGDYFRENADAVLGKLMETLRSQRVSEVKFPLMREEDRLPFARLDEAVLRRVIRNVLAYPEKDGLLTSMVRDALDVPYQEPADFVRIEMHFDSKNKLTDALRDAVVSLGLEDDNFHAFIPVEYQDHATLRFNVPSECQERRTHLRTIAMTNIAAVQELVQDSPGADGYTESELYRKSDKKSHIASYPFQPIAAASLEYFPFARSLVIQEVPTTVAEVLRTQTSLDVHKAADIHIEIPSTAKGEAFAEGESEAMNALRSRLIGMGFYEVKDVWGDTIYTAQFQRLDEAKYVYRRLNDYFQDHGGPTQMYLEPCLAVWRKQSMVNGDIRYANVPPLVAFGPTQRAIMEQRLRTRDASGKRFGNALSDDYRLLHLVVPHEQEFQEVVGTVVQQYCESVKGRVIRAVEIGVGTGLTTGVVLRADPRLQITGIDNERRMLEQAEQSLAHARDRVTLVPADARHALRMMSPESADIVYSAYTIHNLPPEERVLLFQEIARVLRTGGLFVNADKLAQDDAQEHDRFLREFIERLRIFDVHGRSDLREEWEKHYLADETIKFTEQEQRDILRGLHFGEVQLHFRKEMEAVVSAIKRGDRE